MRARPCHWSSVIFIALIASLSCDSHAVISPEQAAAEAKAIEALTPLGVSFGFEDTLKGKTVIEVSFCQSSTHESDLKLLREFRNLKELSLQDNTSDSGLANLKPLNRLQILSLRGAGVTDAGLAELTELISLNHIDLAGTKVTGRGLKDLKSLGSLRSLELSHSDLSDDGVRGLGELQQVEVVGAQFTTVTNAGLKHLRGMRNAKQLDFRNSEITAEGAMELQRFLPGCVVFGGRGRF